MRMHRVPIVAVLLMFLVAGLRAVQAPAPPIPGVTHYTRVDATVACGGATSPDAYAALKAEGFAAVINLRQAEEPGADIDQARAAAKAAGLRYIHVPLNGHAPSAHAADAFLAAVRDPDNSPVYIHCATANRVGAVWLIKRVVVDGWDVDKATAEAERVGLRSPVLKQFALDYIAAHKG